MPYHSNDELLDATAGLASRAADRAAVATIGETVEGRPIRAVTVAPPGQGPDEGRPQALLTGNVHGQEVIGSEVALAVLDLLAAEEPAGPAAELLALADVTVVPAVNLDARSRSVEAWLTRAPLGKAPRGNAHGVDLNRNFPYPKNAKKVWYPLAGTSAKWLPWYRGPEVLSEPETQALVELCGRLRPRAAVNLHSVGRLFLYPYCYTAEPPADLDAFRAMGEAFVAAQPAHRYKIKQSRSWYAILGDMDDWMYDTHRTLSVTIELSKPMAGLAAGPSVLLNQFAWMNPPDPAPTIDNCAGAVLAALAEGCRQAAAFRDQPARA